MIDKIEIIIEIIEIDSIRKEEEEGKEEEEEKEDVLG